MGHVLVVDDNILNVKLLEARLQVAAYAVETASSGAEALAKVAARQPDIVLLDVMMPGMDGYEVCRRLRAGAKTRDLPVVLVTALDKPSDREEGLAAGADDFLTKPVGDEALFGAIERLTADGGGPPAPAGASTAC
ncbi:MAG: response regulator [Proteobacteria bacterium]|nr:response regulator [Pseudomonadota bacterium]